MIYIFFGSDDGMVHALDLNGNSIDGWPQSVGNEVIGSVLIQDLNGDSIKEVIAISSSSVSIKDLSGQNFSYEYIASDLQITGPPIIND